MDSQERELTGTEKRARELFDASVESLDGNARARLAAARRAAVAEVRQPRGTAWRSWAPAAAMASVALVAVLLWRAQGPESPTAAEVVAADVIAADSSLAPVELLANGDDLGLVENDLAFYEWLDANGFEVAGSSG
ncbi:MAG: hypothetical protein MUO39_03240 [Steroidobacteraceae bacterium]|nr:hypothetical protein [Steroidobacteraceae bacterium]